MPDLRHAAVVPCEAHEMYAIVDEVAAYPDFLSWCREVTVHSRTERELSASLRVSSGGVDGAIATHARLYAHERISMSLHDGPFRRFSCEWHFEALSAAESRLAVQLRFELANPMLGLLFDGVVKARARRLVEDFAARAESLYGTR